MFEMRDKTSIEKFMRRDPYLHLYGLGDLDDRWWPLTKWYGAGEEDKVKALCMIFQPDDLPVLSALEDADGSALRLLLSDLLPKLPAKFYLHLTPGLEGTFANGFLLDHRGTHRKMKLDSSRRPCPELAKPFLARALTEKDISKIERLYAESYPEHWFDKRGLATGVYQGIFDGERLISIGGIHVYSPRYGVAVLGNITTHPQYRGRGLGTAVTALVAGALDARITHTGLNVDRENTTAIRCYERVGFRPHTLYEEYMVTRTTGSS